jgi:hypothetical protein
MSRDADHGGDGWGFGTCLWAPSATKTGVKWPFWASLLTVQSGDPVLHLQGKNEKAGFVGWSIADANGYETDERPPKPKKWAFAKSFNRVPLRDFTPLLSPIPLRQLFSRRDRDLRDYFQANSARPKSRHAHLFYVIQSDRLQCLNGAYLSEVDSVLHNILLGIALEGTGSSPGPTNIATGEQLRQVQARVGQSEFSEAVKANYGYRCCFPGCAIEDVRFLVGSHIARWADAPELRGSVANGLCLCLMHDKAFEVGLFTVTERHTVHVNEAKSKASHWARSALLIPAGAAIRTASVMPSTLALAHHWRRTRCDPNEGD